MITIPTLRNLAVLLCASVLVAAPSLGHADVHIPFTVDSSSPKHEVYLKGGILGLGVGYAHAINPSFTLRGDVTTAGRYRSSDRDAGGFRFDAKARNDVATLYGDWFPLNNGFRVSFGLGFRDTHVKGDGHSMKVQGQEYTFGPDESAYAKVKLPTVTPYLGIGYGHNIGQKTKGGWTFTADAGVYYGKPRVDFHVSDSAYANIDAMTGGNARAEVNAQRREIEREVKKYKFMPALYVGVGYRF